MKSSPLYLLALTPLCHAFSLDTQTEFWNYTTTSLADTTSQKCKNAYSAQIDCDPLLAALVKKYISNVEESCSYPKDAALAITDSSDSDLWNPDFKTVPVETIANLVLYTLMRSCAKEDGENCYVTQSAVYSPDYACKWDCATALYWNTHKYPYYNWYFGMGEAVWIDDTTAIIPGNNILVQDWFDEDEKGWKKIVECGLDYKNGSAPFDIGITGLDKETTKPDKMASKSTTTATSGSSTATTTPKQTTGGVSSSPTSTGAAGIINMGKGGLFALAMAMLLGFSL
ncbi:hypothetical protein FE257_013040 [Aspergillus nanangensis]|uniref:Uncharacterized protein n=1 Tax=Aspergillus nanangensis TaxID=2582783 RepID=A0AAD4CFI2_ASPNN|nr:hypothetical protein FE257_013040 [Aspergillus nanangensis]